MPPSWLSPTVRVVPGGRITPIYVRGDDGQPMPVGVTILAGTPDQPEELTPAVLDKLDMWPIIDQGPIPERLLRVAEIVRDADAAGRSRAQAVAADLGISIDSAYNYLGEARRKYGLIDGR